MLAGTYVTTRANNDFKDCLVKLAYCGDGVFKEIDASVVNPDPDPKSIDSVEEELEEDIHCTGILSEPSDEEEEDETDGSGSDGSDSSDSCENDFSGDEGDPDIQPSASNSALDLKISKSCR